MSFRDLITNTANHIRGKLLPKDSVLATDLKDPLANEVVSMGTIFGGLVLIAAGIISSHINSPIAEHASNAVMLGGTIGLGGGAVNGLTFLNDRKESQKNTTEYFPMAALYDIGSGDVYKKNGIDI